MSGDGPQSVPMIVAGSDSAALLAQDTRFDPRLHLRSAVRLGIGAGFTWGGEFATGVALVRASPTSADPGYGYAGWTGRAFWVRMGYFRPSRARFGVSLAASGVLAGFDSTYLITFFPVVEVSPALLITLPRDATATISIPIGWDLRRDLGLAVGDAFVLPGALFAGISTEIRLAAPRQDPLASSLASGKR